VDILLGIGGAPEGVIAAAGIKCLGGQFQGKLVAYSDEERERCRKMGADLDKVLLMEDLAKGDEVYFAATGISDGEFLKGVRYTGHDMASTHSVVMRSTTGTLRFIEATHKLNRKPAYAYREIRTGWPRRGRRKSPCPAWPAASRPPASGAAGSDLPEAPGRGDRGFLRLVQVVAGHGHRFQRVCQLELEDHQVAPEEGAGTGGKVELPHAAESLATALHPLVTDRLEPRQPLLQGQRIMPPQHLHIGADQAAALHGRHGLRHGRDIAAREDRSEERRVGKECGPRRTRDH